ncbi:MAG: hypothetical protein LUH40_04720, partial [Clostridiales bacterium]|nr:hypothetical protein [Clostridiales bacterium]
MSDILKKHKSIAVIITAAALIAAAVFAVAVYRGRSDNPYVKTEEYLEIEDSVYISDILEGSEILDPLLPEKYTESEIYIYSEKIISEKRYTEITLETEYGSVMLIKYNYAYL